MAPTPAHHPLRDPREAARRRRSIAAHPAGRARPLADPEVREVVPLHAARPHQLDDESGSMATEYGLIVVVGATICSLVIKWASGGAVFELLGGVLDAATGLLGF